MLIFDLWISCGTNVLGKINLFFREDEESYYSPSSPTTSTYSTSDEEVFERSNTVKEKETTHFDIKKEADVILVDSDDEPMPVSHALTDVGRVREGRLVPGDNAIMIISSDSSDSELECLNDSGVGESFCFNSSR